MQFQFYSESYLPQVNTSVGNFVSELVWGEPDCFGPFCSMAIANRERMVAGIVYNNYQPDVGTIEISAAALNHKWLNRKVLAAIISMPFNQLKCQAIFARYSGDAEHISRICTALGASEYEIPRLRGKGKPPEIVAVLTDDAWAQSKFNRINAEVL